MNSPDLSAAFRDLSDEQRTELKDRAKAISEAKTEASESSVVVFDADQTPLSFGCPKYPISKDNLPPSPELANSAATFRASVQERVGSNNEVINEPSFDMTTSCEALWGTNMCGEKMTHENKSRFLHINSILKKMQHFDSGLRIGGIAGDAEPIRLFFFEFDVDANPFTSEQDVRGTLLFLIATCLSPAITIFFAMDVDKMQ